MIFVCAGTQIFQFDRLMKKLDELVASGIVQDEIFAQIGATKYIPQYYKYKDFISKEEFNAYQKRASIVISHGGTGALISASKLGKNIIAVPRLAKYKEHVDDHQLQVVKVLEKEGYVRAVYDVEELGEVICEAIRSPINKVYDRKSTIISIIINFIEET